MKKVKFASDCSKCECCDEPWCDECNEHYADCSCPGPHQDDIYEYIEINGELYAKDILNTRGGQNIDE